VLDAHQPDRAIVFCSTKRMVDEVSERLQGRGYVAEGLHGDITQSGREKVLRGFREGRTEVLVATDVAARGLDIPEVSLVVNFDIPPDPEYYVHRIGRTGRVGRGGAAVTFVNPREVRELQLIERATGARIRRTELPTAVASEEREAQLLEEQILEVLEKGTWQPLRGLIEELLNDHDPMEVAAAAATLAMERKRKRTTTTSPSAPSYTVHAEAEQPARRPYLGKRPPAGKPAGRHPHPKTQQSWRQRRGS
jgi:ATP-dependent RNA helicase DeaD